jgi:hypothetical protein
MGKKRRQKNPNRQQEERMYSTQGAFRSTPKRNIRDSRIQTDQNFFKKYINLDISKEIPKRRGNPSNVGNNAFRQYAPKFFEAQEPRKQRNYPTTPLYDNFIKKRDKRSPYKSRLLTNSRLGKKKLLKRGSHSEDHRRGSLGLKCSNEKTRDLMNRLNQQIRNISDAVHQIRVKQNFNLSF